MANVSSELIFCVKNLGRIYEGKFTHKSLTVFCGPNNSGKTWAMYSLYHCYRSLDELGRRLEEKDEGRGNKGRFRKPNPPESFEEFNDLVSRTIPDLFNTSGKELTDARFEIETEIGWRRLIDGRKGSKSSIFLMPAERNGLHLFFRELSTRRTALLHHASKASIDVGELLRDVIRSRYATPIADYINWLNSMAETQRTTSEDFHVFAEKLKKGLAKGVYTVDKSTGNIEFKPYQVKRDGRKTQKMGLHMTSSTVKSLFGLWFYLEYQACPGDVLMIDEPELNIHPENQRKIARLLAKLVNAGLKIVLSTHSDYIIREFNSLIMLNREEAVGLRKKHRYEDDEILRPDQVGAYLFDNQTITPFEITLDDGIYATTFDEVIQKLNTVNNDIYYSLQEKPDNVKYAE